MKKVTIPTCANPFVVIVNGIKYTYPAGATMEVPDDVAEVIEQHEEAKKPEPAPVQPPYSGDDILAEAKAYTDKKCGGTDGEIIDFTPFFDFAESLIGTTTYYFDDADVGQELVRKLREKGFVKIKVAFNGMTAFGYVGIVDMGSGIGICQPFKFYSDLIYMSMSIDDESITYECRKLTTEPYMPS